MKTNKKIANKINDLKNQIDKIVNDINDVKRENNEEIFDISLPNRELLEKENLEISKSLNILEEDNEKLFSKVSILKNEVEKAIENFDKESHLLDMFKDFINSHGDKDLNSYSNDSDLGLEEISSDNKDEILSILKNKEDLDLTKDTTLLNNEKEESINEKEKNVDNTKFLNFFTNVHNVFETEIKKINEISSNKESFLKSFVIIEQDSQEENNKKINNKLTTYKNEFNQKINSLFEINFTGSSKKENKIIKDSYKNSINDLYDKLQEELLSSLIEMTKPKTSLNNSILKNGINYIDIDNIDQLKISINKIETEIHSEKIKYNSSPTNIETLNDFLFFNKIDSSFIERNLTEQYFNICENFIKNTELKKEVLEKLVNNLRVYCDDSCNQLVYKIDDAITRERRHNIALTNEMVSQNNFFAQKSIEFIESLKNKFEEINNELEAKISNVLSSSSFESLKRNKIDFDYLATSIKEMMKEISSNVHVSINAYSKELEKIVEIEAIGLDKVKVEFSEEVNEIFNYISRSPLELEEILKDAYSAQKEFLQFKLLKLEQVLNVIREFNVNESKNKEFSFDSAGNEYVGARLNRLERQFSKIANMLEPIANKLSGTDGSEDNFEEFEGRLNKKIDDLISKIAFDRENYENKYSSVISEILNSNEAHKENVLNLIKSIEEEKMNLISEESRKSAAQNSLKLGELEELIGLQSEEIENLLNEKDQFIGEVEKLLIEKREKLSDEKISDIKNSINDVILNFSEKINDLENTFDRKLNTINLDSLDLATNENQKELFNKIEETLVNNYQIVKEEVKQDLFEILNNVNELSSSISNLPINNFDSKFASIDDQFNSFRILLKEVTENIIDKNSSNYENINNIVDDINTRFESLISRLRNENNRTVRKLNKEIKKTNSITNKKIDNSLIKIGDKFVNLIQEIKDQNKNFENNQLDVIYSIIEENKSHQREIVSYIKGLEENNNEFINSIETQKLNYENNKLRELEELISLQNEEIENLLDEKNDFVNEIETFLLNKKNKLDNENINRLEDSINVAISNFNEKISNLEDNFNNRISHIDLSSLSKEIDGKQIEFLDSVQSSLSYNYELVKNEFKDSLSSILENINEVGYNIENVNNKIDDISSEIKDINLVNKAKFDSLDSQFNNFRELLKEVTEGFLNKESSHYDEISNIVSNIDQKFSDLISSFKSSTEQIGESLIKDIEHSNKHISIKMDSSIMEMNSKFDRLMEEMKHQSEDITSNNANTINMLIESNKNNQQEIFNYINSLKESTSNFVNELQQIQLNREGSKLKELEALIDLQNSEIESLINDKDDFIDEIQNFLNGKREIANNENFRKLENSIENVIKVFDKKIDNLEFTFDRKLINLDLSSLKDLIDSENSNLANVINSIETSLNSNYEILRNELKLELNKILEDVSEANAISERNRIEQSYKIDEVNSQFDQFREIIKAVTEDVINKNETNQVAMDDLLEKINDEFRSLIQNLRSESGFNSEELFDRFENLNNDLVQKFNANFDDINIKFDNFINKLDEKTKSFEENRMDLVNFVYELNKEYQKNISSYIEKIELMNANFINELDLRKYNRENQQLKELESLIDVQNDEIIKLIDENNKYINEVENFLINRKDVFDNEKLNDIESSINEISNNFDNKIKKLGNDFSGKINSLNVNEITENLDLNEKRTIDLICAQLTKNYELLSEEFRTNFDSMTKSIESLYSSYGEESLNLISSELNKFYYEINEGINLSLESINKNFNLLIKELETKNKNLEATQVDAMNLILESNKINSEKIISYIENLRINTPNEVNKDREALILNIFDELKSIIDLQNDDIRVLLEERDRIIDEIQKFINRIEDQEKDRISYFNELENSKKSLKLSVENLKNKINILQSDLSSKFDELDIHNNLDIDSESYKNILRVEQNLKENYSFLNNDLTQVFGNIFDKIDDLIDSSDMSSFSKKVDELKEGIDNIDPILSSIEKLNKKNNMLDQIQDLVFEKIDTNKSNDFERIEEAIANSNEELSNKISKLDDWYKDLAISIENKNEVISSFVENKLSQISSLNLNDANKDFKEEFDLEQTYNLIVSKISEISNLLNLSKKNVTGILNSVNARLSNDKYDKVAKALKWFNKIILFYNKSIDQLNHQNNKYIEFVNASKKNKTILKDANEVLKSLDKILDLLKNEFNIFELEQKVLISIFKKSLTSEDDLIINFLSLVSDLSRSNIDLSSRMFINLENKNNIDLIKLHSIEDSLKEISESIQNLDSFEVSKENYINFNKELDKVKNLLLRSHLDLVALKESQIENSILNPNGDIFSVEYQKIVLLDELVKYTKDYLKNIYSQKVKLVDFLANSKDNNTNCLIEYKASLLCDDLSSQLVQEQLKDLENVIKKIDESFDSEVSKQNTKLFSAKNFKNKSIIYSKISLLELEIGKLFEIIDNKKKVILSLLINDEDNEVQKIISRFEDSKEMIQNEFNKELEAFKDYIFKIKEKEIDEYKNQVSEIEQEISKIKKSNSINNDKKNKELEALDNLIEVLNMEITSFEQEKEDQYNEVKEKLAYLNSLSGTDEVDEISNIVNTDKFKINLNNEVRQYLEETFNSFTKTFNKNLDQLKVALELIKSAYSIDEEPSDEIDNPAWFKTFDEKLKDIETDLLNSNLSDSKKYVNQNEESIIKLEVNSENIKSFIVESESKKKEIEAFYAKVEDLLKLKETK